MKITKIKGSPLPPIPKSEVRQWVVCKECGRPAFYDYLPYSLSNPVMTLPCCHSFHHSAKRVSDEEALTAIHKFYRGRVAA